MGGGVNRGDRPRVTVRTQSDSEIVVEAAHRRIGAVERPLISLRRGLDHVLVEDRKRTDVEPIRLPLDRVESIRLVPAAGRGLHHWRLRTRAAWTLALHFKSGEDLVLEERLEASAALDLAHAIQGLCNIQIDEPSRRMFGLAETPEPGPE